jgi:hypothetical protein
MLSDFFNILMIMLMLTGALFWVGAILLCWYYWACKRPSKEKVNV